VVLPGKKVHLEDLWEARRVLDLRFTSIHYLACRVNKKTFDLDTLVISGP
jgi:hypothetical protein